jgi:periplasmic protein CpxP/Spy
MIIPEDAGDLTKELQMTDNTTSQDNTPVLPQPAPPVPARKSFFKNPWVIAGAFVLTGIAGFGLGKASSFRGHHMGWAGYGMSRGMDSSSMNSRAEYGINRVLSSVDATVEQKNRITTLVQSALAEMQPMRQSFRDGREKLAAALKATTIDRTGVEALRAEQLQKAEVLSRKMQDTLLNAADILSPAQRAQLVERWQSRASHARGWRG